MKIKIIIVNYNGYPYILECLKSLKDSKTIDLKSIIIVDNASLDNSLQLIKQMKLGLEIIKNNKNLGFAKACNIGIKEALQEKPDFILLLNPDVQVDKRFLKPLVTTFTIK